MATHDYSLANQSGASFRTDLNNALAAISSNNSNSSSPATTYAYQWWADTSAGILKLRNSANNAANTVTFGSPFFAGTGSLGGSTTAFLPTIGITLEGAVSGDYFKITSITGTQFVIETRDSSNAFKDLSFKYTAIGFGKGS